MVKQVRAARTREALIRAAAEVFADDGYALASLPAISKRAGVSTGALHFHFASKDVLAAEVEGAAFERVARLAEHCRAAAGTSLQSLVDTSSGLLHALADDPVVRAGFRLGGDPSRKNDSELLHWWHGRVRDLIVDAQGAGELERTVSADAATTVIVASMVGFGALGVADRTWLSAERVAPFWSFLVPRLAASPHRVSAPAATGGRDEGK
ncbi:ScbR family autoregulator-binding transcription factor [Streptomyces sp. NBC_00316]|uniref:ScbR family autoregulator-binding transcription factor n=1 Tax=Streptomyces sp. NBC_00316 TaxID=2975710 RepID=UPI002E2A927D|nr:ScbR family autoregulator-binding transcription factor [Streptomyces sp. NBC_00316]